MNITIPGNTSMWELVAGIQLLQQIQEIDNVMVGTGSGNNNYDTIDMLGCACLNTCPQKVATNPVASWLSFSEAYRKVDDTEEPYVNVLAEESGLAMLKPVAPRFPLVTLHSNGGIVLAPFGLKRELDISQSIWGPITQHLRSYKHTVYQIGDRGQRQNFSAFTESEVLSNRPIKERLEAIASAKLVVGVPNAWTWIAAGFGVKTIILYPDHLPPKRWYPFASDEIGRIAYQAHQVQTPIMLTGLRQLIKEM
jgi:hypothetical protein